MRGRAYESERTSSDPKRVEAAAVRLLARREHSSEELRRKLLSKGYPAAIVAAVVEKLTTQRFVSDERFAASDVRRRAQRGQGPIRIRAELRQQGVGQSLIDREFAAADIDWAGLAAQVRQRKFGAAQPVSLSERAKQARFLQYRGFNADQIRAAFGGDETPPLDDETVAAQPD